MLPTQHLKPLFTLYCHFRFLMEARLSYSVLHRFNLLFPSYRFYLVIKRAQASNPELIFMSLFMDPEA